MVPGATYFFTVVTHERRPILDERTIPLLGEALRSVRASRPFQTLAMVVLPDHMHCVWSLPLSDTDYPDRWKMIKRMFTFNWVRSGRAEGTISLARRSRGERGVWQRRFWEHLVRDDKDLERCCDYIHYNPVKHGHAVSPGDWRWSTFAKFERSGNYPSGWGQAEPASLAYVEHDLGE
jgi:putative transposase